MRKKNPPYMKYERLIAARAWRYAKATGLQVDELIAIGNEAYVLARASYDPARAQFSTWLVRIVDQALRRHVNHKVWKLTDPWTLRDLDLFTAEGADPFRWTEFFDTIDCLSRDAQRLALVIIQEGCNLTDAAGKLRWKKNGDTMKRTTNELRQALSAA